MSNASRRLHGNEPNSFEDSQPDLFGWRAEAKPTAASRSHGRALERLARRESIRAKLETPWEVWSASGTTAQIAIRYLSRHPDFDRPDPAYDLLTDRQAAVEYHLEEEALEIWQEQQ